MRVVFFGSGAFGLPTLRRLADEHEVVLVVTQPDRAAGRRRQLTPTPIGSFAAEAGLPVLKPESPNDAAVTGRIHAAGAEAFVVIAYGHKLGPALLENVFAINLHASLLPKYRGAAPIQWAVIEGEPETGVSVIGLAQRMDAGDVYGQRRVAIDPYETAGELHDRLADLGPDVVLAALAARAAGTARGQAQDADAATGAPKLAKSDGTVGFDRPASAVRARVHGLTPWPGCTVQVDGRPLKLLRVRDEPAPPDVPAGAAPGQVLAGGVILCAAGVVRPLSVQPPGGKAMSFEAYCRGHQVGPGARMEARENAGEATR